MLERDTGVYESEGKFLDMWAAKILLTCPLLDTLWSFGFTDSPDPIKSEG